MNIYQHGPDAIITEIFITLQLQNGASLATKTLIPALMIIITKVIFLLAQMPPLSTILKQC